MHNHTKFRALLPAVLALSLFWTPQLFGSGDSLSIKLHRILDRTEEIRQVFLRIAQRAANEGAPGWDRTVDFCESAQRRIAHVRNHIDTTTHHLTASRFPFFSGINSPGHTIEINVPHVFGSVWHIPFPNLNLAIPGFPPSIPFLGPILSRFLDILEEPLDEIHQAARDLDTAMSNSLARIKTNPKYRFSPAESDSFPGRNYFYPRLIREWLGAPGVVILAKEVHALLEGHEKAWDGVAKQTLTLVGEGGNLAMILKPIFTVFPTFTAMVTELVEHIEALETLEIGEGSYERLEYIHVEFNDWKTLSIRTRVEINLAGHSDHPHPIAPFQLPARFGGFLELARDIVEETIVTMVAAGQNVYQATTYFNRGNGEFAAGRYKKAYDFYAQAYGEATK